MIQIKNTDIDELKSICNNNKYVSYKLEKNYLIYRDEYLKSKFENLSFLIQDQNKNYCLAIIFHNKKLNELDFYGHNCELIYRGNLNNQIIEKFIKHLKTIKQRYKIKEVKFILRDKDLIKNELFKNYITFSINNEIILDLVSEDNQIQSNFKSSLRNELKKNYSDVKYKIINKNNYIKKEILKMKSINEKIFGLEKRELSTWLLNEKWILNDEGFLVQIKAKNRIIGYSLFFYNRITCKYFASCILTEYFKIYRNLQHLALWFAIKYSKSICKNFYIGLVIEECITGISEKEINIGKFKSKFNKISEKSIVLKL